MLVFVATAIHQQPDWAQVGQGFIPSLSGSKLYLYFVVGVFAAALMPYEVHFYSSGAVEEGWTEKSLKENRLNAVVGYLSAVSSPAPWWSSPGICSTRSGSSPTTSAPSLSRRRERSARPACCSPSAA